MICRGVSPPNQMESSVCRFDRDVQLLYREKLRLYPQLKLADLHQLTLYQELLLLQEFESREEKLQEKLDVCIKEENNITVCDIFSSRVLFYTFSKGKMTFYKCQTRYIVQKSVYFTAIYSFISFTFSQV